MLAQGESFAQIGNEIRSFVDTTEQLVSNGRKLLLKSIQEKDLVKAEEIYNYLNEATKDNPYKAFYFFEELHLLILLEDWGKWTDLALNFKDYEENISYPSVISVIDIIYPQIEEYAESYPASISSTSLDSEDKKMLKLFVYLYTIEQIDEQYRMLLEDFKNTYPNSKYNAFIQQYMPKVPTRGYFGYAIGAGYSQPLDKLSLSFDGNATFNFSLDWAINKYYGSLYAHIGGLKLQTPFDAYSQNDTLSFTMDESFSFFQGGLISGYYLSRNEKMNVAAYVNLSGSSLQSTRFDEDDDNEELYIFNSFTFGPGIHTAIKLTSWEVNNPYVYGNLRQAFLSLKFDAEYSIIAKHEFSNFKGNMLNFRLSLVWAGGRF